MLGRGILACAAAVVLALAAAGCGEKDEPDLASLPQESSPAPSPGPGEPATGDGQGGVRLEQVGEFDQPVFVTQAPGEQDLFVVEQPGRIMRVPAGGGRARVFLDIRREVSCCGEQGLLSLAFAPDYRRSGRLYVDFTNRKGDTRVVEYTRSRRGEAEIDPGTAREVLAVDQPYTNHNGGLLIFGPDDLLYVGLGDGGGGGDPDRRALDPDDLLGKLLRIDPREDRRSDYRVPASNPFAGGGRGAPEVYSLGLRNPWRFSFDRATGDLWIGDVGQDAQEEVNGVDRGDGLGASFGWSAYEGTERFNDDQSSPDATFPVLTYGRDQGCSVTGGYVVRDRELTSLYGRYLYGDFCQGELRSFTAAPGRQARDDRALGAQVPSLSSFGEDRAGHLYATSLEGPVYRLRGDG